MEKEKLTEDSPMLKIGGWYEHCIEEPIRDVVKLLRDHGFNTECSCGHGYGMYIQCQYIVDGEIQRLHDLLHCYFYEQGKPIDYEIIVRHKVVNGHSYTSLDVQLPKKYDKVYSLEEARQWFDTHPAGREVMCIYKDEEYLCKDYSKAEGVYVQ